MGRRSHVNEYHLTEPVKISMLERSKLVKVVDDFVTFCEVNFPTSVILYMDVYDVSQIFGKML